MDERQNPRGEKYKTLPVEDITIDQVVAWNMRHWRRASNMTQEELGELIGWSAGNVSAAERSIEEHRDRRRFDAQTIADIAGALRIPIVALFLPPADDGVGKRYQWHTDGSPRDMASLMMLAMHDNDHKTATMTEYRDQYQGAVNAYLDEEWGKEAGRWFAPMDDNEARAEQAARFRSRQATLLRLAAEDEELADFLDPPDEEEEEQA